MAKARKRAVQLAAAKIIAQSSVSNVYASAMKQDAKLMDYKQSETVREQEFVGRMKDISASLALAHAYEDGNGVPQDKSKAMDLYRSVAEVVTIAPSFMTGGLYERVFWDGIIFDVMAQTDGNDAYDMTRRGYAYEHGQFGVAQDKKESMKWYQKAADAGDNYAMFALGNAYSSGEEQDEEKALMWYLKAAEEGVAFAAKDSWIWEALRASRAMTEKTFGIEKDE